MRVESGELVGLRSWHPRPGERVSTASWELATRWGPNFRLRPVETDALTEPERYLLVPALIVDVAGSSATTVVFDTAQGRFRVQPAALRAGESAAFLGGRVIADRTPYAQKLSGEAQHDDGASLVAGPNGELWAAWVAFTENAEIRVSRFDGRAWGAAERIGKPGDIFQVKLARDAAGRPWAIWSEQVEGNFDLYASRFDGRAWSSPQRLTSAPQPDVWHAVATDAAGRVWVVWQGFRSGSSDILARSYDASGAAWSEETRLSTSPANDWAPAVAADSRGSVYVAWDTYDQGNYDVMMRSFRNGQWSEPMAVAATPKFEANVTLACDRADRLWVSWNESGFQWGKDFGFLVRMQATPLYLSRWMGVAVFADGRWQEPVADLNEALPAVMRDYNDLPTLLADAAGRVWLFFRHRTNKFPDTPATSINHRAAWEIWATAFDGDRWRSPVPVPFSQGRNDMRAGFAAGQTGVYAAWPTDNRDFEEYLFAHADVYAGRMPDFPGPAEPPKLKTRVVPKLTTYATHENESADLARIRAYAIQSGGRTGRIYRGDTHRHTEFSFDGQNDGSLLDAYRYALDAGALDYLMVSEHRRLQGPDVPFINWLVSQTADVFNVPGSFVPLFGYERSLNYPNGHRNVVFARRGTEPFQASPDEYAGKIGAQGLFGYLRARGGISIPHTSASNMGTDWRDNDPEVEPLVEIYQGDRVSAEYEGAPKAAYSGDPTAQPGGFRPAGYVWNAWAKGYKLGVQASSDHLSTHISYACTIAEEFTREGLLDAMRRRHNYAATDNIILDYRLSSGGREYVQGDIGKRGGEVRLAVRAIGTRPIRQVDIIRNNRFIHTRHPLETDVNFQFADADAPMGESYYYVRVIQVDDQMAWSSPVWLE